MSGLEMSQHPSTKNTYSTPGFKNKIIIKIRCDWYNTGYKQYSNADPDSVNPNPAFQVNPDTDPALQVNPDPGI